MELQITLFPILPFPCLGLYAGPPGTPEARVEGVVSCSSYPKPAARAFPLGSDWIIYCGGCDCTPCPHILGFKNIKPALLGLDFQKIAEI